MVKRNMDVPWSYTGDNGPEYWHTLCEWYEKGASYPYQSPIALDHQQVEPLDLGTTGLTFTYQTERFTEKEFKNTIHFIPFECESYVSFKGKDYALTDIHYHLPSEHVIDGEQKPVEIHLVHMDHEGNNLVVAVLCEIVEGILAEGPLRKATVWDMDRHLEVFDPTLFLPEQRSHFHYVGSLTTPPTKGPINWFVFDQPGKLSRTFLSQFNEEILQGNNRPLQDKKGRAVYYVSERK
ncbi:carbonic anhydrase family protein [Enterococcus sp. 2201sp1_2201st1_B8_2201SCRN_220225]|uniref:carbonic anhydrase family protein n=1 Tax=unclassified Enterococcus TaxID=2608891 RepID=UPI0034A2B580